MKLAWPLQGFLVIFLIISSASEPVYCVDLVVVIARTFAPEIVVVVAASVPPFSVVVIVIAPKAAVVEMSTVVSDVVQLRRLLVLLDSSNVFSDELFCVIGVIVILGHGEELSDRAWPLAQ